MYSMIKKDLKKMFAMDIFKDILCGYLVIIVIATLCLNLVFSLGIFSMVRGCLMLRLPLILISLFYIPFLLSDKKDIFLMRSIPPTYYYKKILSKLICLAVYIAIFFLFMLIVQIVLHILILPIAFHDFRGRGNYVSDDITTAVFFHDLIGEYMLYYAAMCAITLVAVIIRTKKASVIICACIASGIPGMYIAEAVSTIFPQLTWIDLANYFIVLRIFFVSEEFSIANWVLAVVYTISSAALWFIITRARWNKKYRA